MADFPTLTDDEVEAVLAKGPASRLKYFLESVARSGMLCAWGDDENTSMMEDADGITGVPVWPHPAFAEREFGPDAEPGEKPVPVELDRFLGVWLPFLENEDDGVAVFPVNSKIAVTLTPAQFRAKIAARRAKAAYKQQQRDAAWQAFSLSPAQLADLQQYLTRHLDECDDDLTMTRAWAAEGSLDPHGVERGVRSQDSFCDCEVLGLDPDAT